MQLAGSAPLDLDRNDLALDLGSQFFSSSLSFGFMVGFGFALGAGGVHSVSIGHCSQTAREQEVAGVTVRHFMDFILFTNALDILFENNFHRGGSPLYVVIDIIFCHWQGFADNLIC